MDTLEILLQDPPFWGAVALFIFSASVFLWSAAGLRTREEIPARRSPSLSSRDFPPMTAAPVVDKKSLWTFPPPEQPPESMSVPTLKVAAAPATSHPAAAPMGSQPPVLPGKGDSALVLSVMEDKFAEMAKRLTALEHPKKDTTPPAFLDPLLKRVHEMETEMKNLKFGFTQLASAQNAININEVTSKIQSIQKMLETLTGGTDVSKPS
jgi:hypothetical protein